MAEPSFYPEGATLRIKDTERRRWIKKLGSVRNSGLGTAANNPRIKDSLRRVKLKLVGALRNE